MPRVQSGPAARPMPMTRITPRVRHQNQWLSFIQAGMARICIALPKPRALAHVFSTASNPRISVTEFQGDAVTLSLLVGGASIFDIHCFVLFHGRRTASTSRISPCPPSAVRAASSWTALYQGGARVACCKLCRPRSQETGKRSGRTEAVAVFIYDVQSCQPA